MVLGDVHGDFPALNRLLVQKRPDLVLQVGDFGFWPTEPGKKGTHPYDPAQHLKNHTSKGKPSLSTGAMATMRNFRRC
jgi:hypothetical protein